MTTDARRRWEEERQKDAERSEASYQKWLAYHDADNMVRFEGEERYGSAVRERLEQGGATEDEVLAFTA